MKKIIVMGILLLGAALILAGCGGQAGGADSVSTKPIKATWITPQVAGATVSIPFSDVENDGIVHFNVAASTGKTAFMAYNIDGQLNVRANVCPPCRSIGFSLVGDTLVCNTCGTVFKAGTGAGVSGACVGYPKASVAYTISDGQISMQAGDLQAAYQDTITPG
jgi:nitrite reductase/ring-hydroxylating ferredoxin subunit